MRFTLGEHAAVAVRAAMLLAPVYVTVLGTTGAGLGLRPPEASSPSRCLWLEALGDVLHVAGGFATVHILCAFPQLCLQVRLPTGQRCLRDCLATFAS